MSARRTALASATLAAAVTGALAGASLPTGAGAALAAPAADSTPGYSLHHISVHTVVGPHRGTKCLVDADLYVPDGASARHRKASILTTNGFGGSKDDDQEASIGRGFVRRGYVVLAYTGLGFPDSGCKIRLDDPDYDGKAGKQLVDVLAGTRSYVENGTSKRLRLVSQEKKGDPRVGMIGGSYGGQIQYAVAEQDRRVDALIPIITWNDLSYSLAPNNTSLHGVTYRTPGVGKKEWVDLFFGAGIAAGGQGGTGPVDPGDAGTCPNFSDAACAAAAQLNTIGYPDRATLDLSRHASVSTYIRRVKAPTLVVQGQGDTLFNLQESVATFTALRAQHTATRLIWQSWGHSDSTPAPGELDFDAPSLRSTYLGNRFLDWMNHYVRGSRKAPVGPRFSYFRDWVDYDTSPARAGTAIRQAYAERSSFSEDPTASLYLSGSDALVSDRAAVQSGSSSYLSSPAPTSYSETSGLEGGAVNNPVSDAAGTFAAFTTPALSHAVRMVGSPRLTLHLDAPAAATTQQAGPAGKLVLFAKIYDLAPDGTKTLQHRLISPVRVTDVTEPVSIQLPDVVQRFPAGHRISVVVAASDLAYAANAATQPVQVVTSQASPGVLRLPLNDPLAFE